MSDPKVPPPAPSPSPKDETPDVPSGVWRMVNGKLVNLTQFMELEIENTVAAAKKSSEKRGALSLVLVIMAGAGFALKAWSQVKEEAKKTAVEEVKEVKQDVKFLRQDIEYQAKKADRTEKLVEAIAAKVRVREADIPPPIEPQPPKDAGR